jgi:hypothetical protein
MEYPRKKSVIPLFFFQHLPGVIKVAKDTRFNQKFVFVRSTSIDVPLRIFHKERKASMCVKLSWKLEKAIKLGYSSC